ncbi:MAG: 4Fe-4S dicluster domain-containing protein [Nitrospinae bacterium]|nr:4Fe-4S dicluster domain-containing protein [Nitrospinota bacterium]
MPNENENKCADKNLDRRRFLKSAAVGAAGLALSSCSSSSFQAFFQDHFREMDKDELLSTLKRMEEEYSKKYGKKFTVSAEAPIDETLFGYGLDISRCIGCRRCVYACVEENNQSRDPQIHWISVLRFKKGDKWMDLENSTKYYDPEKVPEDGYFYVPIACQQCENPPCTKVCPVQATWKEPDGIVVVDYNWCIGCRYCMAACPYGARHFNLTDPGLPAEEVNPKTHYLGNRPRPRGVVEKCTFCIQRTRKGLYPACSEICPMGARKFGNILDPESEIRYLIDKKRVFRLKEDLNTLPKFYYFI